MIADNLRDTVRTLHEAGKGKKEIARYLGIDVKTVRSIISSGTNRPGERSDRTRIDEQLLRDLYASCNGYVERMHEILVEDHHISIGYSTLTRLVRKLGLSGNSSERFYHHPDVPGEEMQHDTSLYHVVIGGKKTTVIASGLYLRYCKMRYVKFSLRFTRFVMKCFFHAALAFFGYTARICIIDNTNLAVLYGSGENACFHPEMIAFARQYGFTWKAHRIGHANRKAGEERSFFTLTTNFFPGRTFKSLDDLNEQVFTWATERFAHRPLSRSRLIPAELFESEKPYLVKLPGFIQPPYQEHVRKLDENGYIEFGGNFFWIPEKDKTGNRTGNDVNVVEYEKRIDVYWNHETLISYDLPSDNVRNKEFYPGPHRPTPLEPANKKKGCDVEEQRLKEMGDVCSAYVDFIESPECRIRQKPRLIRDVYRLSKKLDPSLFEECISRALTYKIDTIESVSRIASRVLSHPDGNPVPDTEPSVPSDDFSRRPSYVQGEFSFEADPAMYSDLLKEDERNG
jgi:hypothetical protein